MISMEEVRKHIEKGRRRYRKWTALLPEFELSYEECLTWWEVWARHSTGHWPGANRDGCLRRAKIRDVDMLRSIAESALCHALPDPEDFEDYLREHAVQIAIDKTDNLFLAALCFATVRAIEGSSS